MKLRLILLCLLFTAACTKDKGLPEKTESPKPNEVVATDFSEATFRRDIYSIRGQRLDVVIAEFDGGRDEYAYMLVDDGKERTFFKARRYMESLINNNLTLQEKEILLNAQVVLKANYKDHYIQSVRDDFDLMNVLSLDRCRTNPIWNDLRNILKSKRDILYLGYDGSWPDKPAFAIRWDLSLKKFKDVVSVSSFSIPEDASKAERKLILWPLFNPEISLGEVATDSYFLWPNLFLSSCDETYERVQGKTVSRDPSFEEQFLPLFEPSADERASVWSENYGNQFKYAFFGNEPISIFSTSYMLSEKLKQYARTSPLYRELYGEQK